MTITNTQKYQAAMGNNEEFAGRVFAQLARQATFRMDQGATGQELSACRSVWQNPTQYRIAVVLAVLNGPLLNKQSFEEITDPDLEAAVGTIWPRFLSVYFPTP